MLSAVAQIKQAKAFYEKGEIAMSFFQKDKKAKSEKDHQQVDQLLEEASKELAGDPLPGSCPKEEKQPSIS